MPLNTLLRPCSVMQRLRKVACNTSMEPRLVDSFFPSEKNISKCVCVRETERLGVRVHVCVTSEAAGENEVADWCWNGPCKSAFIPLLQLFSLFVSV